MEQKTTITPTKGMDIDSSAGRRDPSTVYVAVNVRLNNTDDVSVGEYSNFNGLNVASLNPNYKILKIDKVADEVILFIKQTTSPYTDFIGRIAQQDLPVDYNDTPVVLDLSGYYWEGNYHKITSGDFGFDLNNEIWSKTYFESLTVKKIYWDTYGVPLRSLNIMKTDVFNPSTLTPSQMEIVPSVQANPILINKITSGNLKSGKICYSYQLSTNSGSESIMSQYSSLISLSKSSPNDSTDYNYVGTNVDDNANRGVGIKISGIPTSFTGIKMYSIHYQNLSSLPIISLIYDGSISGALIISDLGNPITTISPEEFLSLNSILLRGGLFEVKNNRLFISNYEESYFDVDKIASGGYWDSRAYRFTESAYSKVARIYNADSSLPLSLDGTNAGYDSVPADHDCINVTNDISNSSSMYPSSTFCAFKSDGINFGASGKNISITQNEIKNQLIVDNIWSGTKWYSKKSTSGANSSPYNGFSSYANPMLDAEKKTFKLEEVYRVGIQFRNSKSQLSYPKWICDYKFNFNPAYEPILARNPDIKLSLYTLTFFVANVPLDPETGLPLTWRIVYVPIEETDVGAFWGVATPLVRDTTGNTTRFYTLYRAYGGVYDDRASDNSSDSISPTFSNRKYYEFTSPDYCFNNIASYSALSLFKQGDRSSILNGRYSDKNNATLNKLYNYGPISGTLPVKRNVSSQIDFKYDVDLMEDLELNGTITLRRLGRTLADVQRDNYDCIYGYSNRGRTQILTVDSEFPIYYSYNLACAYPAIFESKYGGLSYESRKSNRYIQLHNWFGDTGESITVYGDCYFGLFEHLRHISDNSIVKANESLTAKPMPGSCEVDVFPVMTQINLNLRSGTMFSKKFTENGSWMIHEQAGVYDDPYQGEFNPNKYIYTQDSAFYVYNKTYSRVNDLEVFWEKPISSNTVERFPYRILASKKKILGEKTDSFLKSSGGYIDVDGQYGEVLSMNVSNDRLYFFQEKAFGIVAVNERSQTIDSSGSEISMGEIGLLSRYDYVSISNGISKKNHVTTSDNNIYLIDSIKKQLLVISGIESEKISATKSINNLVKQVDWNDGFIVHNKRFNEVLFFGHITSYNNLFGGNIAIVYNEEIQRFTQVNTYENLSIDSVRIASSDLFDEILLESSGSLKLLNSGNYNQIGNTNAFSPSSITYMVSAPGEEIVLFNVVEFLLKHDADFVNTIRVHSATKDTGSLTFNNACKLKFGKYRLNNVRNYEGSNERILDNYVFVTITTTSNYINGSPQNKRVFFRDLSVYITQYNWFK